MKKGVGMVYKRYPNGQLTGTAESSINAQREAIEKCVAAEVFGHAKGAIPVLQNHLLTIN
jgi:hypothetical protein